MPFPKPIRVISDLHLGHPACRIEDVSQLRPLFEGAGTVIFNGDTAELRSPKLRAKAEDYLSEMKTLLAGINTEAVFLRGNHDPQISSLDYIDLEDENILIIHGDCFFHNISPWNPKLWKLEPVFQEIRDSFSPDDLRHSLKTWLEYIHQCRLQTYGDEDRPLPPFFKKIRSALRLVLPLRRPIEIMRCWMGLGIRIETFQQNYAPGKKYIIAGHTHRPGIFKLNGGNLIGVNTGGYLSIGKASIVDIDSHSLKVRKVKENGATLEIGKTIFKTDL